MIIDTWWQFHIVWKKQEKRGHVYMVYKSIQDLSKEKLLELIEIYSKNWLAHDGLWFQSIEKKRGMEEALEHDINAMTKFTVIEANRMKEFLGLEDNAGLEGLEKALGLRFQANLNEPEFQRPDEHTLILKNVRCRVQYARTRKGMALHPCKPIGLDEYKYFAKTIDDRIETECISCPPDVTDESASCIWKFTL